MSNVSLHPKLKQKAVDRLADYLEQTVELDRAMNTLDKIDKRAAWIRKNSIQEHLNRNMIEQFGE